MTDKDFGFYFETAGRSAVQGATSSEEEHFKDFDIAESLVREMGQNSLDARAPENDGPVRMVFELRNLKTGEIPDYENLIHHVVAANESTKHIDAANTRLKVSTEYADWTQLPALRISDYGTTGLTGAEDDPTHSAPIVALTRARGVSAGKVGKGGSFGVGASTGALSSAIRTVLWTSYPNDGREPVFAGQSQLATHDLDGVLYGPDGFYINRNNESFEYLRGSDPLGPFPARDEFGTDTYILGYLDAADDPNLEKIKSAFVANFFVAIHRGLLVVEGITDEAHWVLDSEGLREEIRSYEKVLPFYKALLREPYSEYIEGLGRLSLYVEMDDQLPKKLHTMVMRKPLMKVETLRHDTIRAKYAAVFIAEDEPINTLLREVEPPAHNKWVPSRAKHGNKTVTKVKSFIRTGLRSYVQDTSGEEIPVEDMTRLLPSGLDEPSTKTGDQGVPKSRKDSSEETSMVHGARSKPQVHVAEKSKPQKTTRDKGTSGGDQASLEGSRGGEGKARNHGGTSKGSGQKGDGESLIADATVSMRSWNDPNSGEIVMLVKSDRAAAGDLVLTAVSEGGEVDEDYRIPIERGVATTATGSKELEHKGNIIRGVVIDADSLKTKLRISLKDARRLRLDIL